MGGYGSGSANGRLTVESCLTLDLNQLLRERSIILGQRVRGTLWWTVAETGREVSLYRL